MLPNSGGFQLPAMPSSVSSNSSNSSAAGGSAHSHQSAGPSTGKYACPNCGKCFARDDLLRRHLAREARAMAQPQFDRQKSCFECARSKARCDLEVPSCGRCRSRGKQCTYGARSGNPNVRRQRDSTAPPHNLAAMNISHQHPHGSPYMGGWSAESYSDSGHAGPSSYMRSPGPRRHSGDDESGSESSTTAWSDTAGHSSYGLSRSYSSGSSSSSSLHAPHNPHVHHLPPMQHAPPNYPLPDSGNVVTPTTYLARHSMDGNYGQQQQQHMQAGRLVTDIDRSGMAFNAEEGEETPIGRYVNSFAAGPSSMDVKPDPESTLRQRTASLPQMANAEGGGHDAWPSGPPTLSHPGLGGMTPQVHSTNLVMGPPTQTPIHRPFVSGPVSTGQASQRPQPHRLLTGANMPQPAATQAANPPSGKPLFSAMVDLSGWLEEPVAPSPLYPQGPSLASSLGLMIPKGSCEGGAGALAAVSGDSEMAEQVQQQQQQAQQQQLQQQQQQQQTQTQGASDQIPASRYWWSNPPTQSDVNLMQSVAQATASHLSHYPHLMVLPDPSSPVPPTVHRPWMAHIRGSIPPSLAIARVILAGYAVRLPASEHIVWEGVARETRRIVATHEATCARGSDLEVFGATEALFFYCILLMMCTDPGASAHVDMSLTNSAFYGLSELSKSLSMRLQAMQRTSKAGGSADSNADWMAWGFEETMRRTLWAAYAILVLQRFRDGAVLSEGHLAGVDLIMDVHLPAVAAEFEAGSEDEWRRALSASGEAQAAPEGEAPPKYTFRDLLRWRPCNVRDGQQQGPTPQALLDYFDKHDAFVATVLSIAFCLDSMLSS